MPFPQEVVIDSSNPHLLFPFSASNVCTTPLACQANSPQMYGVCTVNLELCQAIGMQKGTEWEK